MRSKICGLLFLSLSLAVVAGCRSQGGYVGYICDPNSAYANGMIDARSGKAMKTNYGASCPVQTWAMRTSYRRGYERGVLLSPLPGGEHPLPPLPVIVKKPVHLVSFEPQKVQPPALPARDRPVYLNRSAPSSYRDVTPVALNANTRAQPWPPTAATGYQPMKPPQHDTTSNRQPWPPTADTRYKWMTLSGKQWPQNDMAPPTRFTTAQPVILTPTPTSVVATTKEDFGQQHSSVVIPPPTALTTAPPVVLHAPLPKQSTATLVHKQANHHHHPSHYRSDAYHKQPPYYRHAYHHRHPVRRSPVQTQVQQPVSQPQQMQQPTSQRQIAYIAMN